MTGIENRDVLSMRIDYDIYPFTTLIITIMTILDKDNSKQGELGTQPRQPARPTHSAALLADPHLSVPAHWSCYSCYSLYSPYSLPRSH